MDWRISCIRSSKSCSVQSADVKFPETMDKFGGGKFTAIHGESHSLCILSIAAISGANLSMVLFDCSSPSLHASLSCLMKAVYVSGLV